MAARDWTALGGLPSEAAAGLTGLGSLALRQGDCATAERHFAASLASQAGRGEVAAGMENLVGLAAVSAATGDPLRAVRYLAVAARLREDLRVPPGPVAGQEIETLTASLRGALGEAAFAAAWSAARTLPFDELVPEPG